MITRFGSLYAGHVDLDDHGFDATPVNERWMSNERLLTAFDKATRIPTLMDRGGYDVFSQVIRVPRPARALVALTTWARTLSGLRLPISQMGSNPSAHP